MKWRAMPWALALATAPAAEPRTYAEVKARLRLPDDTEQTIVTELIGMARQKVEQDTGLKLITQAWDYSLDAFPEDAIIVPTQPLASVTSIKTTTAAGVQSTLAATNYQVDTASSPPRIVLSDTGEWPSDLRATQAVVIRLSLGYGASGAYVPAPLLKAVDYLIELWYRGANFIPPPKWVGYDELIRPYRLPGVG